LAPAVLLEKQDSHWRRMAINLGLKPQVREASWKFL
jgi:hypothetical protein